MNRFLSVLLLLVTSSPGLAQELELPKLRSAKATEAVSEFKASVKKLQSQYRAAESKISKKLKEKIKALKAPLLAVLEAERKQAGIDDEPEEALRIKATAAYFKGFKEQTRSKTDNTIAKLRTRIRRLVEDDLSTSGYADLLSIIDPAIDSVLGDWEIVDGKLHAPKVEHTRLRLSPKLPAEYVIIAIVERTEGKLGFGFALPFKEQSVTAYIHGGYGSGLSNVGGKGYRENETHSRDRPFVNNQPSTFVITVKNDFMQVVCDGKTVIHWKGNVDRLSSSFEMGHGDIGRLQLIGHRSAFTIHKLSLVDLSAD